MYLSIYYYYYFPINNNKSNFIFKFIIYVLVYLLFICLLCYYSCFCFIISFLPLRLHFILPKFFITDSLSSYILQLSLLLSFCHKVYSAIPVYFIVFFIEFSKHYIITRLDLISLEYVP